MCGRYTMTVDPFGLKVFYGIDILPSENGKRHSARYNIAPTQFAPVVVASAPGRYSLREMKWGLLPGWAKDPSIAQKLINARSETAAEKPAFKSALRRRRCAVPTDGFYEWKPHGRQKTPMWIHRPDRQPFALAGLWETWRDPAAPEDAPAVESFTILTTAPNALMAPIHDRMPVVLGREAFARWLDPSITSASALTPLLGPAPEDFLEAHPVSTAVNNPRNDAAELIEAAPEQLDLLGTRRV